MLTSLLVGWPASAQRSTTYQTQVETATFQMLRATVEFLASDTKTFGYVSRPKCDDCTTDDDLQLFIKENKLQRADDLVRDGRRKSQDLQRRTPPTNPENTNRVLSTLQTYLIDKVTAGIGRRHRLQLPAYSTYKAELDRIVSEAVTVPVADSALAQNTPSETETDTSSSSLPPQNEPAMNEAQAIDYGFWALCLSILNLAGLLYLLFFKRPPAAPVESRQPAAGEQIRELSHRLKVVESERVKLENRVKRLEEERGQVQGLQNKVQALETAAQRTEQNMARAAEALSVASGTVAPQAASRPTQPADTKPPVSPAAPSQASAPASPQPAAQAYRPGQSAAPAQPANRIKPKITTFYARNADLGDGFSVSSLLTAPDRDTVFEIQLVNDGQAEYRVADNADAQRMALSDPYSFLNETCMYMTQPQPGSRIRTDQPGKLALQGEKWTITDKAQISFV
ncbi:hypothetical protein GCM10023187_17260 [Nibrella viscosa]|uniref:Uncharacterized protein n=2 Tax=Nibrella viscosa TaxID=1084524 RepID=A0ABP8K9S8_9BACT